MDHNQYSNERTSTGRTTVAVDAPEPLPAPEPAGNPLERGTFYATTPIFYVNAEPHMGHAYTTILVDVVSRFHRLKGDDTFFLTGTDEHGENVQKAAEAHGKTPQEYTDEISGKFRTTWDRLGIRYDDFIRTTEERHKRVVREVLQRVHDSGDIIYGEYSGLYCVKCERYYTDKELVDGKCPQHEIVPEYRTEANYFFRMEKYRLWLRDLLNEQPDLIRPERYRNEILAMLREPIGDLSISRPRSRVPWGIPLPWDEDHVTYVWFDALINYYSALVDRDNVERYWPHVEHFVAKDILKPHGLFWPTMLKAAGIPLYQHLNVHGYWLYDERKMSKSLGNVVRPLDLMRKYGNDAFRYFLMRDMTFGLDASFNEPAIAERINADLANDLGNLLNRTLGMLARYRDGIVPAAVNMEPIDVDLREAFTRLPAQVARQFENLQFDRALESVMESVRKANKYIAETKPWELAKDPASAERLDTVLNTLLEALRCASILLDPVIPSKAHEMRKQLGIRNAPFELANATQWGLIPTGTRTAPGDPLFPRIDLEALEAAIANKDVEQSEAGVGAQVGGDAVAVPGDASAVAEPSVGPAVGSTAEGSQSTTITSSSAALLVDDSDIPPAELEHKAEITINDFARVELRVVTVVAAEQHPNADKLLVLTVSLGGETRTVVSGIKAHYQPEALVGKRLVLVTNLQPVKLRGIESQGMILAAEDEGGILSLITLDRDLPDGSEVR
ncbi:MAG TPA: methionine--tRNA ligase [Trueperaceae bacterium]|nr:methionine--tRNA ligase [Trueperaceae bacterium]